MAGRGGIYGDLHGDGQLVGGDTAETPSFPTGAKDRDDAVKQALEVGAAAAKTHLQSKGWSGERTAAAILGLGVNLNGTR